MRNERTDGMSEYGDQLMRALDGEFDAEEQAAFEARLAQDEELREEWRRLSRAREATMGLKLRDPPEDVWDGYWTSVYSRVERGVGWLLLSVGGIVVGSWAVWRWIGELLADTTMPAVVRYGVLAVFFGLVVLLVSVVRHRVNVFRTDPYRDIER
ncbi:MAG: anti-sigma factor family protein [Gemmatimonadota bacterium]